MTDQDWDGTQPNKLNTKQSPPSRDRVECKAHAPPTYAAQQGNNLGRLVEAVV